MASLDHRLNPLFSIKECSSCGALYTADFCCSKGGLEDKILVPKPPQNCATCGDPVDGLYCRSCAFVRKCLNEGWYTIHDENEILNTSESSNHNTNIVSAPQEPIVFNQDPDGRRKGELRKSKRLKIDIRRFPFATMMLRSITLLSTQPVYYPSDDESLSDEDVPKENFKIYSNPLFNDEEIISLKIDSHYFNAESNLIESLLNHDILIDSSPNLFESDVKGSTASTSNPQSTFGSKNTADTMRNGKKEESKALVTVDGEGVDWTNHSEEDKDYALMACNGSDSDTEREQLSDASIEIKAYSQGLKKVEAQLVAHQQG
ncbi:hypothetical protein Tco_1522323 [Tanacetum coccineum]